MDAIDFLKQDEVVDYIHEHQNADVSKLVLNPPARFKEHIRSIADQILARQKAAGKLDRWVENQQLIFPPPLSIEQASSGVTAKYKAQLLAGQLLVDLTGGTGIDCLALGERFGNTVYVEKNEALCEVFRHNASVLGKSMDVQNQTAEAFLSGFVGRATFFLDPARRDQHQKKVVKLEDCSPNVAELIPSLREKASQVLVKLSPLLDITQTLEEVPHVKDLYIVSVKNDCKELLLLFDFAYTGDVQLHAINLESDHEAFTFYLREEEESTSTAAPVGKYLYEANASILKSGAFKLISQRYPVRKVARHTHLYSSDELVSDFPGRAFETIQTNAKSHLSRYEGKINVLTRNYPIGAAELKKRFKLKDGGRDFLIGFKDFQNKATLVIAKRHY